VVPSKPGTSGNFGLAYFIVKGHASRGVGQRQAEKYSLATPTSQPSAFPAYPCADVCIGIILAPPIHPENGVAPELF